MTDPTILRDEIIERDGERHREIDVQETPDSEVSELGWLVAGDDVDVITLCRRIVEGHQATELRGVLIDLQTANLIVQIHDKLSDGPRAKLLAMYQERDGSVGWLGDFCWRLYGRVNGR